MRRNTTPQKAEEMPNSSACRNTLLLLSAYARESRLAAKHRSAIMNPALAAILFFFAVTICFQTIGFLISRVVDLAFPAFSLITFLMLFIASLYMAWPVAVYLTERFVDRAKSDVPAGGR